jgi:hypothetical protein
MGRAETSVACKQHVLLSGKKENKILRIPTFIIFFKDCDFQNISFDFFFHPLRVHDISYSIFTWIYGCAVNLESSEMDTE